QTEVGAAGPFLKNTAFKSKEELERNVKRGDLEKAKAGQAAEAQESERLQKALDFMNQSPILTKAGQEKVDFFTEQLKASKNRLAHWDEQVDRETRVRGELTDKLADAESKYIKNRHDLKTLTNQARQAELNLKELGPKSEDNRTLTEILRDQDQKRVSD